MVFTKLIDIEYEILPLTVKQSLSFAKQSNLLNTFQFYKELLNTMTTLDARQVDNMLLCDVYTVLVQMLSEHFELPVIDSQGLTSADLIIKTEGNYEEQIMTVGKYRFSSLKLTLKQAIDCEKLCYIKGDADFLGLYLLAGSCLKNLKAGVDTLLNTVADKSTMTSIRQLNNMVGNVSFTRVDFLLEPQNVCLITRDNTYLSLSKPLFFYTWSSPS